MHLRLGWIGLATIACATLVVAWDSPRAIAGSFERRSTPVPSVSATTLPALPTSATPIATPTAMPPTTPTTSMPSAILAPPGTLIQVTGAVAAPIILTLKDLQAMSRYTLTLRVLDPDGRRRVHIFTGPLLRDILNAARPTSSTGVDMATHAYALVTGMTGASALVAFAESDRAYNGKQILIAYEEDGRPLPGSGIGELIVPEDVTQGRFIMGVTTIEVGTP